MPRLAASTGFAAPPLVSTYVAAASTSAGELGVFPRKLENNTPVSAGETRTSGDANMSRRRLAVDASSATVGLSRACADSRDGSRGGSTSAPAGGAVARPIVDGIDARAPAGPRAPSMAGRVPPRRKNSSVSSTAAWLS